MKINTRAIASISTTILVLGFLGATSEVANAVTPMTATILEFPSSHIVADGGEAPFDVEFSGGKAMTNTTCRSLISDANLNFTWSYGNNSMYDNASGLNTYQEGTYVKTLAITPTGLKCQIGHVVGWGNHSLVLRQYIGGYGYTTPLVDFQGAESAQINMSIKEGQNLIGSGSGPLYNAYYAPYSPEITGITRGQQVNRFFQFGVTNPPPSDVILKQTFLLDGVECTDSSSTCEVVTMPDNQYMLFLVDGYGGDTPPAGLDVQVVYRVKNRSQWWNEVKTSRITLSFGAQGAGAPYMDWSAIQKSEKFALNTDVTCSNKSENAKTKLKCTATSVISRFSGSWTPIANTTVPLKIIYQFDNGAWKSSSIEVSNRTGTKSPFTFVVPNKSHKRLRIRAVNTEMKTGTNDQEQYGAMPTAPRLNNYLSLPSKIQWNVPFTITATPKGAKASSCTFYDSDETTVLGRSTVRNGRAQITARTVWAGAVGTRTTVVIYAACKYGTKTYWDYSYTYGYR